MMAIWIQMLNLIIKLIDCQIRNNLLLIATKFEFTIWKMASNIQIHSYHKYITRIQTQTTTMVRKMKLKDKYAH